MSSTRNRVRYLIGIAGLTALLGACGGSSSSTTTTTPGTSSTPGSSTPASTSPTTDVPPSTTAPGPATAAFLFSGSGHLDGALNQPAVSCSFPWPTGPSITVGGNTNQTGVGTFVIITSRGVVVRIASGSGTTYLQREFSGGGVSGFNPSRGAELNSTLIETVPATGAATALPAATKITGSVNCNGQTPGTSAITINGMSSLGAVNGTLSEARVTCSHYSSIGDSVSAVGVVQVGGQRAILFVNSAQGKAMIVLEQGNTAYIFNSKIAGTATVTTRGVAVSGTVIEQPISGHPAPTAADQLQVSGSATCGSAG